MTDAADRAIRIGVQVRPQHGEYRAIRRAVAQVEAPTRRIPALIGGGGEKVTLRIAAEHADIWHGFGDVDVLTHKNAILDEHCRAIGRDPAEIERSGGVSPRPGRFAEDVADYAASAEQLLASGTRLLTIGLDAPDYDLGPLRDLLAWRADRNR